MVSDRLVVQRLVNEAMVMLEVVNLGIVDIHWWFSVYFDQWYFTAFIISLHVDSR